jgi:tubulin alpha
MVPFHKFRFLLASYSPILNYHNAYLENKSLKEITLNSLEPANMMAKCDTRHGKFMAFILNYRGDICKLAVSSILCQLKFEKMIQFV